MKTPQELRAQYVSLYDYMADSQDPKNMMFFGHVMTEMMDVMLQKMPTEAEEMIQKLEAIRWKNYLTPKEADGIIDHMEPSAPWKRDLWKATMEQHGFDLEHEPAYNQCALYVEMNKIMSDQGETIAKYIDKDNVFKFVYEMAVNNLTDKDGVYNIRSYFGL